MIGYLFTQDVAERLQLKDNLPQGWTFKAAAMDHRLNLRFEKGETVEEVILEPAGGQGFAVFEHFTLKSRSSWPEVSFLEALGQHLNGLWKAETWGVLKKQHREQGSEPIKANLGNLGRVEIRINLECNEDCAFCNTNGNASNLYLSTPGVLEAIERARGAKIITLTGREPTLHPDLPQFVKAASGCADRVDLQTNATLLAKKDLAQRLRDQGLNTVFVSLHAANAALSDHITRLKGGFEATLAGLEAALAAGLNVTLNFVLHRENLGEVEAYGPFVAQRFLGRIRNLVVSVIAPNFTNDAIWELIPDWSELTQPLARMLDGAAAAGLLPVVPNFCGLPACLLPTHLAFFEEAHRKGMEEQPSTRTYGSACDDCALRSQCSGVWTKMLERYGDRLLKPLTKDQLSTLGSAATALGQGLPLHQKA